MSQENKTSSNASRNFEEAADLVKTIIISVSDLIPLFIEKWSLTREKPQWKEIQSDQRRIKRKLNMLVNRQGWYLLGFILLIIWNISITMILIIKS